MGNNAPRHYLKCDGTVYNIGTYPKLEQHFITEFNKVNYFGGDGTSNFAVPDLRGEFLRGTGTNSHANNGNGADVGIHQDATIHVNVVGDGSPAIYTHCSNDGNSTPRFVDRFTSTGEVSGVAVTKNVNNYNTNYTSRPTNTSVLYCIKYE